MVFDRLHIDAVNRATTTLDGIAGKSINVVKVLKALGEEPVAVGFLGGARGAEIREELAKRWFVETEFIINVKAPTRQCITVIDSSSGAITELVQESPPVTAEDFTQLMHVIERRVKVCAAVVMSGTVAPGGPPDFYARCVALARQAGKISVLDAQGSALTDALNERPGLVKPNREELARTLGRKLTSERDVFGGMRELHRLGAERVVVTAGKDPALAFDGNSQWRIGSPKIAAVNPIGSGDAFTAALTARLLRGDELGEACRWGAAAGAANALTSMPGEVELKDVERLALNVIVERIRGD